jgi:cation diffusion facilitator family transporter
MDAAPGEIYGAAKRVTLICLVLNLILTVFQVIVGILGHSRALVADAMHTLSDMATDLVVLAGIAIGSREADERHPFGHRRVETLTVVVVSASLMAVGLYIAWDAARSIYFHTVRQPSWTVLAAAGLTILGKEWMYQFSVRAGRKYQSKVLIAKAWHHRSDALSSVAVFLGVAGMLLKPDLHILDPLAATIVAVFILRVGLSLLWDAMREFLDTAPDKSVVDTIQGCACGVPGVLGVHDLKVRTSGGMYQMQIHVVVKADLTVVEGHAIAKDVERRIRRDVGRVLETVIHVDPALPAKGAAHTPDED